MSLRRDTHTTASLPESSQGERIAKIIARSGLCSRRDAEKLIGEGRVTLNGKALASPAVNVTSRDVILVDGKSLSTAEPARLWRYHKPKGRVTTHRDPQGRPTVFEAMPEEMPRVISIGRLDFNTEGLLLLTNDGELARHLEAPSTGWLRRYRVRVNGKVEQSVLDGLAAGIEIEGIRYGPIEATIDRTQGANSWLTLALREGKNREVRRIMDHLGLIVNRLIRVSFGPFALSELEPGAVVEVKRRVLAEQLGDEIALKLGLRDKKQNRGQPEKESEAKAAKPERPGRPPARKPRPAGSGKPPRPGGKPARAEGGPSAASRPARPGGPSAGGRPIRPGGKPTRRERPAR